MKPISEMHWLELLEVKHALEERCKQNAMIYQYADKLEAAELLGVSPDVFFNMPYDLWLYISQDIKAAKDRAMSWWQGGKEKTCGEVWNKWFAKNPGELSDIRDKYGLQT